MRVTNWKKMAKFFLQQSGLKISAWIVHYGPCNGWLELKFRSVNLQTEELNMYKGYSENTKYAALWKGKILQCFWF